MVEIFREVKRVLRPDGTVWLNLGDSYNANYRGGGLDNASVKQASNKGTIDFMATKKNVVGLKPKDLVGIPWRVAFALQADGWYLRSDIIWHKPNPMPESVTDRPTKAHEYIFLLSRSANYKYDADAIKEPVTKSSIQRLSQNIDKQKGSDRVPGKTNGPIKAAGNIEYRNKRSVWTQTTKPYKEAHFAVFPDELIIPCIKAGSEKGGIVLDPFVGSGTTMKVAQRLGRNAVGIELNTDYCNLIMKRFANYELF